MKTTACAVITGAVAVAIRRRRAFGSEKQETNSWFRRLTEAPPSPFVLSPMLSIYHHFIPTKADLRADTWVRHGRTRPLDL